MIPSPLLTLNDGNSLPQLGFGVYKMPVDVTAGVVEGALRMGYRHVDTAALYGNEHEVGVGLRASGVPRAEVFVTTKLWNDQHGYDATLRAIDASLETLGLSYVDAYMIHWPVPSQDLYVESWKAIIEARDRRLIRSIGVSNFHPHHIARLIDETGVAPAINQIELHPRLPQRDVQAWDSARGIVTQSWAPLARGGMLEEPALAAIAEVHGRSAAQVVIRWHLDRGLAVIPKSNSLERVKQNFEVFDFELDPEDTAAIDALETGERTGRDPDDD